MIYSNDLNHAGVKGMRWGVRKDDRKSNRTPKQKAKITKTTKRIATAAATAVTVATAAALYAKNKPVVDKFVKDYFDGAKIKSAVRKGIKDKETAEFVKNNKNSILKSAGKINKYKDYLEDDEVKTAVKKLQTVRDLHQLQQDNIRKGANYAQAFLAYTAVATTVYNLKNTPLVKDNKKPKK